MNTIGWAILIAGIYLSPPRDKQDAQYEKNNIIDGIIVVLALLMMLTCTIVQRP